MPLTEPETTKTEVAPKPSSSLTKGPGNPSVEVDYDGLADILDALVPNKTITIIDAFGNEYTARTVISARAQLRVMREVAKLRDISLSYSLSDLFDAYDGGEEDDGEEEDDVDTAGMISGIGSALSIILNDDGAEEFLTILGQAFRIAYPKVYKNSLMIARSESGDELDGEAPEDLFGIEELVIAIAPFFAKALRKILGAGQKTEKKAEKKAKKKKR